MSTPALAILRRLKLRPPRRSNPKKHHRQYATVARADDKTREICRDVLTASEKLQRIRDFAQTPEFSGMTSARLTREDKEAIRRRVLEVLKGAGEMEVYTRDLGNSLTIIAGALDAPITELQNLEGRAELGESIQSLVTEAQQYLTDGKQSIKLDDPVWGPLLHQFAEIKRISKQIADGKAPPPPAVDTVQQAISTSLLGTLTMYANLSGCLEGAVDALDRALFGIEQAGDEDIAAMRQPQPGERAKALEVLDSVAASAGGRMTCAEIAKMAAEPLFKALGDNLAGKIGTHYENDAIEVLAADPTDEALWNLAYLETAGFWQNEPGWGGVGGLMSAEKRFEILKAGRSKRLKKKPDPTFDERNKAATEAASQRREIQAEAETAALQAEVELDPATGFPMSQEGGYHEWDGTQWIFVPQAPRPDLIDEFASEEPGARELLVQRLRECAPGTLGERMNLWLEPLTAVLGNFAASNVDEFFERYFHTHLNQPYSSERAQEVVDAETTRFWDQQKGVPFAAGKMLTANGRFLMLEFADWCLNPLEDWEKGGPDDQSETW